MSRPPKKPSKAQIAELWGFLEGLGSSRYDDTEPPATRPTDRLPNAGDLVRNRRLQLVLSESEYTFLFMYAEDHRVSISDILRGMIWDLEARCASLGGEEISTMLDVPTNLTELIGYGEIRQYLDAKYPGWRKK